MGTPTNGNGGDAKIILNFTYSNGWPGSIEIPNVSAATLGGKLASITQALEAAGCRPPAPPGAAAPAANVAPAPTNGHAAPPAGAAVPVCKWHGPMMASKKIPNGWYCPAKLHDGTYCQEVG